MLNKVFKLREVFPALATDSIESLEKARKTLTDADGNSNECWAPYTEPTLTAYCPDNSAEIDSGRRRKSILICPGGGYYMVSFREAEPVALSFVAKGYNAFVLNYECAPVRYPQALLQVSAAAALIRQNAALFHADPEKLAVCGFSAGGHLAASLGMFWDEPFVRETLGIAQGQNRPNAMILNYPVITSGEYAHRGSFDALLGQDAKPELLARMSLEGQVSDKTPPAFIWHTFEDDTVPVENSIMLARALREKNIPFELHVFPWGGHGASLCDERTTATEVNLIPHCAHWQPLCCEWLDLLFKD
jgi:acetyl esterase/lipase